MSQTEHIKAAGLSEDPGAEPIHQGDHVAWKWGGGMAEGHVAEISESKMVKETKPGVSITRKGDSDNPALLIKRDGGNDVVKKQCEVYKMHDE